MLVKDPVPSTALPRPCYCIKRGRNASPALGRYFLEGNALRRIPGRNISKVFTQISYIHLKV